MILSIMDNELVCANCAHYCQHYIKADGYYKACNAGHCVYPRIKVRKPGCEACVKFQEKGA